MKLNIFLMLFFIMTTSAQTTFADSEIITLPREANIRSNKNFLGQESVIDKLPQGAKVKVLSKKSLPSGADALEIEIISPDDKKIFNKTKNNKKKSIYIWQSKTEIENKSFETEATSGCPDGTCYSNNANKTDPIKPLKDISFHQEKQDSDSTGNNKNELTNEIVSNQKTDETNKSATENKSSSSLADIIKKYSESPQVQKAIKWSYTHQSESYVLNKKGEYVFDLLCWHHVKEALANKSTKTGGPGHNFFPDFFPSDNANKADKILEKKGWINLLKIKEYQDIMKNPANAPKGAVLVYVNDPITRKKHDGHAEIKLDDGPNSKYAYGAVVGVPRSTYYGYKLIGVMIDPNI